MSRKISFMVAIFLPVFCHQGQGIDSGLRLSDTPKRFIKDEISIFTSPFRKSSYDARATKKYLIPFALITATLISTDRKTSEALPNSADQIRWSGRVSQFGAWYSVAGISGATFLAGQFSGNSHARETGWLALESLGHTQAVTFAIKQLTNRERPLDHDRRGGFWEGGTSFPSGHAASAFAVATVFAYEYRDRIAVPITAYSLASLVALSRSGARRHWLSDVFTGGSMGFMIGRYTYRRHHNAALPGAKVSWVDRLSPEVGLGSSGPALIWNVGN
ncbi:MAG: phosphatase PAP2 family protein [Bryobacter sp.]|nr:phosphatase PAP2 family protein [Bryobacter sp.]